MVPGEGVALSCCGLVLDQLSTEDDEQAGMNLVRFALREPSILETGPDQKRRDLSLLGEQIPNFIGYVRWPYAVIRSQLEQWLAEIATPKPSSMF